MSLTPAQRRHDDEHGDVIVEGGLEPADLTPATAARSGADRHRAVRGGSGAS